MKQTFALTSTYSSDEFGVCSALYELGGMVVIHDASGCNSTYTTHDEPRWYDMDSMIYISALSRNETILGRDKKLIDDLLTTAKKYNPRFIAVVGAPVPYMIGTDYKAIAKLCEEQTGIPGFGFDTNGMQDYTRGVRDAMKALAERFACLPEGFERSKPVNRPIRVNILGATPLDLGMTGSVMSLKDWLEANNMEMVSCYCMGMEAGQKTEADGLLAIEKSAQADISIVVSYGGAGAAKVLKEKFGVPFVYGLPFDAEPIALKIREALKEGTKGKDIVIIAEQIYGLSLAEALARRGIKARVLCQLDRIRDERVVPEGITFVYAPEEDDVMRELQNADLVVADPLYEPICGKATLVRLPHMAFSGRLFENEIPNLIGDGEELIKRIKESLIING